jgi:hypothetical protein
MENINLISVIALVVSILTFALNYRHTLRSTVLGRKPILVFLYDGEKGWTLRNVGNGPALNIISAQKLETGDWFYPTRIPSISTDSEFLLSWLSHTNISSLGSIYTDSEGIFYTTICSNDLSKVFDGNCLTKWNEEDIGRHWNQKKQ